ncbi:ArsR/SmtB family transcription factor [Roseateles violae]|uniref:Helix-turn-helix transcriptional regulator n=1 Tax=Roseateles violae TaxID=3058042 RepID=A0ABT8DYL7_9BURK|nr:helix-turn-helix transcriptional regulator [Pelomonas sp. PFR6]MDN3922676.1 helix-turn-helix transcriptional regulator [Pelomonas sp. PFR6]
MNADAETALARVAALIAEPARARMLCSLLDGHARTATELAAVGEIGASTASAHLAKLLEQGLLDCLAQGKHRYYRLADAEVGRALEALLVVAGVARPPFRPSTPDGLREARRCYDHLAGGWGVRLHDHAQAQGWLDTDYGLSEAGAAALQRLGVDVAAARQRRRRLACPCMDWSERRPHLGGALGAAWLEALLRQRWLEPELDSRALRPTPRGRRALAALLAEG